MRLKIAGGHLFDPASGWAGQAGDLYISGDRLVAHLEEVDQVIEAQGLAVLAGGIDLRAPVAGFGQHLLSLRGEDASPRAVGEAYARLGYTHVHEPCLTLATAGAVHRQLAGLAVVDASASLVLNLRDLDLALKEPGKLSEVGDTLNHLLERTRCLDFRLTEPFVRYRQEFYAHRELAGPRTLEILAALAAGSGRRFTLEASPELLSWPLPAPERFHLSGLSRALLGKNEVQAARSRLEAGATGDLGLVLPGPEALAVAVDLGWFSPRLLNARPASAQVARAVRLALDFPGAGVAFSSLGPVSRLLADYPRLLAWLVDAGSRPRQWRAGNREWGLADWAYATRALPARVLGLTDRGRLSPGARADLALYDLPPEDWRENWPRHLGRCRTLIKAGAVVIRDFEVVNPEVPRHTVFRRTAATETPLFKELCQSRSFRPDNLWMAEVLGGPWAGI